LRWPERLYRALLRSYPAAFREEYASEMARLYRDRWRREPAARLWLDLLKDLVTTAPREHARMILADLRYTARMLRKSPLFTVAVVLTIALGIGANTAIFTVVNAVMLQPLPYAHPDRLMNVAEKNDSLHLPSFGVSLLNYLSWKEKTRSFQDLGAIGFATLSLTGKGEPEQFSGTSLTASVMPVLGLHPVAGRAFTEAEEKPGAAPVVMIGEGLWRRRFGADPGIVGSALTLNGISRTVVGIAPSALGILTSGDLWIPMAIDPPKEMRLNHVTFVVGRLEDGVTPAQAQAEMDGVARQVGIEHPEVKDWGIALATFSDFFVGPQLRTALLVLLAAVGCVLLIACANVANLLLARAASRRKEIAVRTAMGASRSRLLRQFLVESLVLSGLGGAAGLAGALFAVDLINSSLPPNILPLPEVHVDGTVLFFAAGVTFLTGLVFGLVPAWHLASTDIHATLKQTSASAAAGGRSRLRKALAASEIALATVLLIGAGLLIQSLLQLQRVSLGFDPAHLQTFQISLPQSRYGTLPKVTSFYSDLRASLEALPGVKGAAVSSGLPLGAGNYTTSPVAPIGSKVLPPDTSVPIDWRIVGPRYFRTMEIPFLGGRDFTDADGPDAPPVMIVSRGTAERFWGTAADAVGRSIRRVADGKIFTVVGVVGDVRNTTLSLQAPALYYAAGGRVAGVMDVVLRTEGAPESVLPAVRETVHRLDPDLPVASVSTMEQYVASRAAQPRLNAILLAVFAGVALLVAAIGIYGVLAYSVNQRTREIGLRMALGAQRSGVMRLVVREGMTVGLAGIAAGLIIAFELSRALASLVYEVPVRDTTTFAGVACLLATVALAACSIPARRASLVDPMVALREE